MDSIFAVQGKDYVLVVCDATAAYSIMKFKETEDKIISIDDNKLMGMAGEVGDRLQFGDLIQKNIHLRKYKTGIKLTTKETANYIRTELAYYLRQGPFQVNLVLAGYDSEDGPSLYWLDYLATLQKVGRAAQGYAAYFLGGIFDNIWKPDMTYEEGLDLVQQCIKELKTRFLISQNNFIIKCVDKKGIREVSNDELSTSLEKIKIKQ